MSYVLFEIGGNKTRVAVSEDLQTIAASVRFDTPDDFLKGVRKIADEVKKLTGKNTIRGVAGSIRGVLDDEKGSIVTDPSGELSRWVDEPLVEQLKNELNSEVYLENDAALVGLGEAVYGAGVDCDIVVYHTISAGVGGVKIEEGTIDEYSHGFEPGHQILDIDHTILGDDVDPTLENLISGVAVEKRMGMKPEDIPQGDAIWNQLAMYLSQGLRNSILYWSPDAIVLGGSMIVGDPRIKLDDIVRLTNEAVGEVVEAPIILDAILGEDGGLYGAIALLNQKA